MTQRRLVLDLQSLRLDPRPLRHQSREDRSKILHLDFALLLYTSKSSLGEVIYERATSYKAGPLAAGEFKMLAGQNHTGDPTKHMSHLLHRSLENC